MASYFLYMKTKASFFLKENQTFSNWFIFYGFKSPTYVQIHTPTMVQGGGGGWWSPSLEVLVCSSILKRFCLQWKAFDLLNKMRYILWVVAMLEAFDITNNGRQLGFYQELEIRLKLQKMVIFVLDM